MQIILTVLTSLFFGYACSQIASKKGRSPQRWFLIGALFGVFALIAIALLPLPKQLKADQLRGPGAPSVPPQPVLLTVLDALHANRLWYYLDANAAQYGPMSLEALTRAWKEGKVKESTFLWHEQLTEWKQFKELLKE